MRLQTRDATDEPAAGALCLTSCGDVLHRLSLEVNGLIPVEGDILDELEGIEVLLIVLGEVSSHLQRAVHRHIERELPTDGGVGT